MTKRESGLMKQMHLMNGVRAAAFAVGMMAVCTTTELLALDRQDVRLYVPFENALKPQLASGRVSIDFNKGKQEKVEFTDGRRGRGLLLKNDVSFSYVGKKLFEKSEGTIAFWVRPVGWQGGDGKYHWFANLFSPTSSHLFYKYGEGGQVILYVTGTGREPTTIGQNHTWDSFSEDRWTHLAMTFKPGEQVFYIDGKPMQKRVGAGLIEPQFDGKAARIHLREGAPANVIDELITMGRALTELEIRALFGTIPETPVVTAPPIRPPTVDGRETDDPWNTAAEFLGWVDTMLGVACTHGTRVNVGHDDGRLFVRFKRPIAEIFRKQRDLFVGSPLKIVAKNQDDDLEADDHVTLLLRSPQSDVYSLAVNGQNVRRDVKNGDVAWNGNWEVQQDWNDHYWIVEFSIPLAKIDPDLDEDSRSVNEDGRWGINFHDSRRQIGSVDVAWYCDAQAPSFGHLILGKEGHRLKISQLGDPANGKVAVRGSVTTSTSSGIASQYSISATKARRPLLTSSSPDSADKRSLVSRRDLIAAPDTVAEIRSDWSAGAPLYGEFGLTIGNEMSPLYRWNAPFVYSPQQRVAAHYLPSYRRLRAVVDAGSGGALENVDRIVVTVRSTKSEEEIGGIVQHVIENPRQVREVVEFDCKHLALGKYDLKAVFQSKQNTHSVNSNFEVIPDPEWLGNDLGKTPLVPRPWIPVRRTGPVVRLRDRQYEFGDIGFPTQVVIGGQEQLAAPVRMMIGLDNAPPLEVQGQITFRAVDDSEISFEASAIIKGVEITTSGSVTFDGYVHTSICVEPNKPTSLDSLTVEFPLKRRFAELWCPPEYFPKEAGRSPAEKRISKPQNGLRMGDAERGLQFSHVNAAEQQLIPDGEIYRVKYEFVGNRIDLEREASTEFSLAWQGLPVKLRSNLYRCVHMDNALWTTDTKNQPFHISPIYTEGWNRHWNYHNFWNREVFEVDFIEKVKRKVQTGWQRDRKAFCMYMNIGTFDANTPEYRRYRFEWVGDDAEYMPPDPSRRDEVKLVMINSYATSFLDFYMWHINKTIRYLTDDGLIPIHCYLDNTVANRDYMLRLRRLVQGINPLNQIIVHMSGDNSMHAYGLADWLVEGEENTAHYLNQITSNPSLPKNYTRILNLDMVRARYSPFAFGDKFYLYQFWGWKNSEPACEHLWGLLAVHDGTTWAAGGPGRFKKELTEFGWDDRVRFIPYWRTGTGITITSDVESVVASGWTRGKKQLLMLIVNDGDHKANVQLRVDYGRFGFESERLSAKFYCQGGLHGEPQGMTTIRSLQFGKAIDWTIRPRSWQLVRFLDSSAVK